MNYYAESMAEEIQMSLGMNLLTGLGDERVAYVSREDLAAAAAGALLGDGHAGAIYNGTGPAVVSGLEKAALVANTIPRSASSSRPDGRTHRPADLRGTNLEHPPLAR